MPKGEKKAGGRPKINRIWSDKLKKQTAKALDKYAKDKNMNFAEALVAMFYDEKVMDTARLGAAKVICDILIVKESERTVENRQTGPMIGLPPVNPKPKNIPVEKDKEESEVRVH